MVCISARLELERIRVIDNGRLAAHVAESFFFFLSLSSAEPSGRQYNRFSLKKKLHK